MKMLGSPDGSEVDEEDETVGKIKLRIMDQSSLTHTVFVWNKTYWLIPNFARSSIPVFLLCFKRCKRAKKPPREMERRS